MLTIENIESIKYQKVRIKSNIWQISNVMDWDDFYEFYLTDGIVSRKVTLDRVKWCLIIDGSNYPFIKENIKTMFGFVRFMTKSLNE